MKIIGVYDAITEKYVVKQLNELTRLGYQTEAVPYSEAENNYSVKYTPSFCILKNNKLGYTLSGKQDFSKILQWVINSGL
jgi:hypothetical protein